MSFKSMLKHRVDVYRLTESDLDGLPVHTWSLVASNVRVFLDLNFIRRGKDPVWSPENGRAMDRSGVLFAEFGANITSGDRLSTSRGPSGTFQVEGAVDEAWRPTDGHHLELGVVEVPSMIGTGQGLRG